MKRQRGRSRNGGGGSGGKPQHNSNRAFDSNGPEGVKVRGAAQHVYEKYQQLARDAHTAGDRVLAENHLQHAEHYFRVMRVMQPQRPLTEIIGRDQFVSGYDMDFEDESGAGETAEPEAEMAESGEAGAERQDRLENRRDERPREDYRQGDQRSRDDRARSDASRSDASRGDASRGERWTSERPPGDQAANERVMSERSTERPQGDRYQADRSARPVRDDRVGQNRDDRPRYERRDAPRRDPLTVVEPEATPLTAQPAPESAHVLRADDGEVNHAPAFLQVRPVEPRDEAAGESRRPRRRRSPSTLEAADAGPAAAASDQE
ncbi:MAG: DUF4167 domain-containing protein [Caulobacteraceae bacterium]